MDTTAPPHDAPPTMPDPRTQFRVDFVSATVDTAEAVRLRHCSTCQATAASGLDAAARDALCHDSRCGLRDPSQWQAEQQWVDATFHALNTYDPLHTKEPPTLAAVADFNAHVFEYAAMTAALILDEDTGRLTIGFQSRTLRGALHVLLFDSIGALAGIIMLNAHDTTGTEARAEVGRERETFAAHASLTRYRHAARLRDQGLTEEAIAHTVRLTRPALAKELGPRKKWETRRAAWWRNKGQGQM